jgi:Tn3 transposase DDE domain
VSAISRWNSIPSSPTTTPLSIVCPSSPIECTDRDAAFVLDGLLYNESELEIEEHYTDTHGYTELNFAAFGMLGLRFCPRIRGVQHQRIYRIDSNRDYGPLAPLVGRVDLSIDTVLISEQWDRMGQLYASLKTGHVTASVALKRLVATPSRTRLRTIFCRRLWSLQRQESILWRQPRARSHLQDRVILQYLSEPELRARIFLRKQGFSHGDLQRNRIIFHACHKHTICPEKTTKAPLWKAWSAPRQLRQIEIESV